MGELHLLPGASHTVAIELFYAAPKQAGKTYLIASTLALLFDPQRYGKILAQIWDYSGKGNLVCDDLIADYEKMSIASSPGPAEYQVAFKYRLPGSRALYKETKIHFYDHPGEQVKNGSDGAALVVAVPWTVLVAHWFGVTASDDAKVKVTQYDRFVRQYEQWVNKLPEHGAKFGQVYVMITKTDELISYANALSLHSVHEEPAFRRIFELVRKNYEIVTRTRKFNSGQQLVRYFTAMHRISSALSDMVFCEKGPLSGLRFLEPLCSVGSSGMRFYMCSAMGASTAQGCKKGIVSGVDGKLWLQDLPRGGGSFMSPYNVELPFFMSMVQNGISLL